MKPSSASFENESALLQKMVNQIGDELIVLDPHGNIVYTNKAASRGLGYSSRALLSKNITSFYKQKISVAAWHKKFFLPFKKSLVADKFIVDRVSRYKHLHVMEVTAVYLKYDHHEYLLSVGRDVTDKVSLQNKLKESELRYRELSERASEGILLLGEDGTIFCINSAVAQIVEDREDEIVNMSFYDYLTPESRVKLRELIKTVKQFPMENFAEMELVTKNGETRSLEVLLSPARDKNRRAALHFHCMIRDVSRKKQVQNLMREAEKMEAIQNFISGTAQEIQYPIHGLLERLTDLLERYRGRDFEYIGYREFKDIMQTLEGMKKQMKHCSDTSDRLLAISKRRAGLETKFSDVNEVIRDVVKKFENDARVNDIRVRLQLAERLPLVAMGEVEFIQVVHQVFQNAMQSLVKGGKISVSSKFIQTKQLIEVEVHDNGVGISKDILPHVFEPFFTTKKTSMQKNTGLGLSIVHSLVRRFKGTIIITSNPRRGTTVTASLPAYRNGNHKQSL